MIPVGIGDSPADSWMPPGNAAIVRGIRHFIVEDVRTARRFIRRCCADADISAMTFSELNRHTDPVEVSAYLDPLRAGEPVGMMSEAGCPGVADPGALPAAIAQREGLRVVPLVGPSSILMGLMGSGFNGQGFSFNGYLPIERDARVKMIRELESLATRRGMTQIFIETPYRNNRLVALLAETLRGDTPLCVACGITDSGRESILTLPARAWRTRQYDYDKTPAIFLIGAPAADGKERRR